MDTNVYPIHKRKKFGTLAELFEQQARYHRNAADMVRRHPADFDVEKWLRSEAEYLSTLEQLAVERGGV